ncbi:putative Lamin-C [Hypsibius exemplaris]|nr:putative Lamin-C [Hypsibius exemplaris]
MSAQVSKKRGGSNPPKTGQHAASSTTSRTESSATSQTIYERQEVETRTQRTPGGLLLAASSAEVSSGTAGLAGSPLSRHQEKEEFKLLNNRFANYIDTIRAQQEEISVLRRKVETVSSKEVVENQKIKERYNLEIANLRRALDEVSRDLAAAIIERDSLRPERDARLLLDNEKKTLQKRSKDAEAALKDAKNQLAALRDQAKDHDNEIHGLTTENSSLKLQIENLKKDLSQETNLRVDAENRLQSEREKNALLEGIHNEEIVSLRNQRRTEITEVETRMGEEYQSKIVEQLNDLRADLEAVAHEMRLDLERSYQNQLEDSQDLANRYRDEARALLADLSAAQDRIKETQTRSEKQLQELRLQLQRLQAELNGKDDEVQRLQKLLADRQAELQNTHHELSRQIASYQELLDEKIHLDAELATYNALLRTEEERLNMKSPPFPSTPNSQRRGTKRRIATRTPARGFRNEASATGDIHISEIDAEGQFVRLENKSARMW